MRDETWGASGRGGPRASRRRTLAHVAAAALVGLLLRAALSALDVAPTWDGVIYERAARMLAAGDGYTLRMYAPEWPWALPTAFYPPGWPAALALLKLLGGPRALDLGLQSLLGAIAIPLAARLGGRAHGHRGARWAAWAIALWPGGVALSASWMGEPLFTAGLLAALLPLARPRVGLGYAGSALAFGVLAYVRPTALPIAVLALGARAFVANRGPARAVGAIGAACLASLALLPLAPWMSRNEARLGAPVISSSAGANLYVGTLGPRFARIPDALDCPDGARELARDRCRRERALARVEADPLGWLELGAEKLGHTFGYEASPALQLARGLGVERPREHAAALGLAVVCSAFWLGLLALALTRGRRARPGPRAIVVAACVAVALVHFAFLGGDRYHLPLVPLIAAVAGPPPARWWRAARAWLRPAWLRPAWLRPAWLRPAWLRRTRPAPRATAA